ncbi:unnamed protein product [Somion occarium]|uniref:Uncharacterized protein n=1 Tax=Somion occarium TaxID=3059160 RepID=A0ABP1CZ57_9APHY
MSIPTTTYTLNLPKHGSVAPEGWFNYPSSSRCSSGLPSSVDTSPTPANVRLSTCSIVRPLPRIPPPSSKTPRPLPAPPPKPRPVSVRPLPTPTITFQQDVILGEPGPSRAPLPSLSELSSESSEESRSVVDDTAAGPMEIVLYGPSNGFGAVHFKTHSYRREYLGAHEPELVSDTEKLGVEEMSDSSPESSYDHGYSYDNRQSGPFVRDKPPVRPGEPRLSTIGMMKVFSRRWVREKKGKRYVEDDYQKIIRDLRQL